MQFTSAIPFDRIELGREFLSVEAAAQMGRALELAGFHAGAVTDHPCPTGRWLDAGGHHAQDPFVMLSVLAANTTKLRLYTGILVLPYRNPFIVARALTTLDYISGGRVTLSVGAGYLKGEYRALGVDFNKRNELMDEYLRALRASLTGEEFTFSGSDYMAPGNRILPGSVQKPCLPILVGGNSRRAIRRAVDLGDGWNPFMTSGSALAATARTTEMRNVKDVLAALSYMRDYCQQVGRQRIPDVVLGGIVRPGERVSTQELVDRAGVYSDLGVKAVALQIEGDSRNQWCDRAALLGAEVVAKFNV